MGALTVTIDPNEMLPDRYLCSGEDGPEYGPVTLYDAIIGAASAQLVGAGQKALVELVRETMLESVQREVDARLPAIIEAAFAEEVEMGDGFSSRKVSLRQVIGERVKSECAHSRDGYGHRTVLDEVMRKQVDSALHGELKADVDAAKAQLRAALQAKAAELLAAETLREAGIR
jgi:hypothetical protein